MGKLLRLTPPPPVLFVSDGTKLSAASTIPSPFVSIWISSGDSVLLVLVALVGTKLSAASTIPSPFVSIWISSGDSVLLVLVALVGTKLSAASTIPSPFVSVWISSGGDCENSLGGIDRGGKPSAQRPVSTSSGKSSGHKSSPPAAGDS